LAASGDDGDTGTTGTAPLLCALGAGAVLGASFVCYAATDPGSGMQPILAARVVSLGLALAAVAIAPRRLTVWPQGTGRWQAGGAGLCDMAASVVLVVAVRRALTIVVAPVAALAPAFTVLWARLLLRERFGRLQLAGICTGLAGLVLIAAG
jgi:drug/metabolite transporter (DMT)-like permease